MRTYIWTFVVALSALIACNDKDDELNAQKPIEVRTSTAVTGITDCSAVVNALITGNNDNLTQRGVYYATEPGFSIAETTPHAEAASLSGTSFSTTLTGLEANTLYYAKAYVVTNGQTVVGNEVSFTSAAPGTIINPVLGAVEISDINPTSAVVSCELLEGGHATERGVCYATTENPTVSNKKVADTDSGLGAFSIQLEGLIDKTTYYVRAYAISGDKVFYSEEAVFMARFIPKAPKITFAEEVVSNIDFTTGTITIQITDNGGEAPSEYGVYYGTSPEAMDAKFCEVTNVPDAEGKIVVNMTGLEQNNRYYLKAFATNSSGTGFSEAVVRFHTAIDGGNGLKYYVLPPLSVKIDGVTTELEFLDRNLGATRVATAINDEQSYGWMFQWGRRADGHQVMNYTSPTKGTFQLGTAPNASAPADRNTADNTPFYIKGKTADWLCDPNQASATDYSLNYYWAAKVEDPLYASGGTNNPCPKGFKVPTATEWTAVAAFAGTATAAVDIFELLGIPAAGYVKYTGALAAAGGSAKTAKIYLWSCDTGTGKNVTNNQYETHAGYVMFTTGKAVRAWEKANALPIRCVRIRE